MVFSHSQLISTPYMRSMRAEAGSAQGGCMVVQVPDDVVRAWPNVSEPGANLTADLSELAARAQRGGGQQTSSMADMAASSAAVIAAVRATSFHDQWSDNLVGDVDLDPDHPCALPTSVPETEPFVPDAEVEGSPADLVYPYPLPSSGDPQDVWPVLMPNDRCGQRGVEYAVRTSEQPVPARGALPLPETGEFQSLPASGVSTCDLPSDTVQLVLRCAGQTGPADLHVMGIMNLEPPAELVPLPPGGSHPHILLIGQDSTARSAFLRHSPAMVRFMSDPSNFHDHVLFDFRYLHSVGHNTNPNTNALFGNITFVWFPGRKTSRGFGYDNNGDGQPDGFFAKHDQAAFAEHKSWLWRHGKQRGYSPWWFEVGFTEPKPYQSQLNGPFRSNNRWYDKKRLDLIHPHWVDRGETHPRCSCLKENPPCTLKRCTYNRYRMDLMWDRMLDSWKRHSHKGPVMLMSWSTMGHDAEQARRIRLYEAYDAAGFERLFATPQARNAFIFYYSDHGVNYGATDAKAGITLNVESKRPMLFMWAPKWWLRLYPHAHKALRANRKALLTAYDLHRTVLEIMDGPGSWQQRSAPWQESLFQPVPRNRTCADAHVPPGFCTCTRWEDVPLAEEVRAAVEAELNRDLPTECMQDLRVAAVESCKQTVLTRTHFDKPVTQAKRADLGKIHKQFAEDVITKVAFRVNHRGQRAEAPVMLATVFATGDLVRVTELRQLSSYGPYIGCIASHRAASAEFGLLAERCICPASAAVVEDEGNSAVM